MSQSRRGVQYQVSEWCYTSSVRYDDPFNAVEMDVVFEGPGGQWRVPAFWAGDNEWRIRFAPPSPGTWRFESLCTDTANAGLHGLRGTLEVEPYAGDHPLLKHGPLGISQNRRTFEFADGTPFFWLGDTWWMGFTSRLSWPEDFQALAADRTSKGFSVIQIVAGLYPDMPFFDPRGANEAGVAWEKDFARINPAYFDMADLRIQYLVRVGLMPCIVGAWAYFLPRMGVDKVKKHWRNLVARWGAYPVVWCLAGEGKMAWYLSKTPKEDSARQAEGWTEVGRYVRQIDPFHRPITIHPTDKGRDQVLDDTILDFDMLQTGHGGYESIPNTIATVRAEVARVPTMPVLVGEVDYEGIMHGNYDEVQRLAFWGSVLSGTAGHTYGANGIWQVNTREQPYGPSPHGNSYGNRLWDEAARLPGSRQLGLAKSLLMRYPWWRFEPHQEWVDPASSSENYFLAYAAGIPGQVRVIYSYGLVFGATIKHFGAIMKVKHLEPAVRYRAFFFHPITGKEFPLGAVKPDAEGTWVVPQQPEVADWIVVLERTGKSKA